MSLDGLVRVLTEEEIDAYTERLNAGISLFEVTSYQKVAQMNPNTGRYLYTGMFEVDGILAFCIERDMVTPAKGSPTSDWIPVTNEGIRKVLYYGYNGPENQGYTFVETAMAVAEANGRGDNSLGRDIYAEIAVLDAPPDNFYAWKVETNDGGTQELAFYTYDKSTGYVKLQKQSAYEELTKYNSNFSLAGAIYGIFAEESCETKLGELLTNELGESEELELDPGIYYVKELAAPKGFMLNEEVVSVTIKEDETMVISVADKPNVKVELTKYKENSKEVLAQATFKHTNPDGTEDIQITGADGKIVWNDLQEGTHQIEEIVAPAGYIRNRNIITFVVHANNKIEVTSQSDDALGKAKAERDLAGNLQITIENKIGYQLPNTGSCVEIVFRNTGIMLMVMSLQKKKRRFIYEE